MKATKIILVLVGVVLLAVAGGVYYVVTNLDSIVKAAIEKYGSEAVQTSVKVSSVSIRLTEGIGEIRGLTVANPRGFTSPHVFRLGDIRVKIDIHSITKSPIVIDEIHIASPQITYELNKDLASNILELKKNILASKKKEVTEKKTEEKKEATKEIKLAIKKLNMDSAGIDVQSALLTKPQSVTLKHFALSNIGGPHGAPPTKIAEDILSALLEQVSVAVAQSGLERSGIDKKLNKEVDRAVNRLLGQ